MFNFFQMIENLVEVDKIIFVQINKHNTLTTLRVIQLVHIYSVKFVWPIFIISLSLCLE